ncbi:MAG: hypothetical protein ABI921_05735 [Panacibacter sp.]
MNTNETITLDAISIFSKELHAIVKGLNETAAPNLQPTAFISWYDHPGFKYGKAFIKRNEKGVCIEIIWLPFFMIDHSDPSKGYRCHTLIFKASESECAGIDLSPIFNAAHDFIREYGGPLYGEFTCVNPIIFRLVLAVFGKNVITPLPKQKTLSYVAKLTIEELEAAVNDPVAIDVRNMIFDCIVDVSKFPVIIGQEKIQAFLRSNNILIKYFVWIIGIQNITKLAIRLKVKIEFDENGSLIH